MNEHGEFIFCNEIHALKVRSVHFCQTVAGSYIVDQIIFVANVTFASMFSRNIQHSMFQAAECYTQFMGYAEYSFSWCMLVQSDTVEHQRRRYQNAENRCAESRKIGYQKSYVWDLFLTNKFKFSI